MQARSIPNMLTLMRLAICPLFLILAAQDAEALRWAAWALLIVALTTDVMDGALARKYQWTSKIGVYLDPAVDKIVLLASFYQVMSWGWLPLWMPLMLMARELIVNSMRSGAAIEGKLVPANWMGKTKALSMSITLGLAYFTRAYFVMEDGWFEYWETAVLWASYATTGFSMLSGCVFLYLQKGIFFRRDDQDTEQKS